VEGGAAPNLIRQRCRCIRGLVSGGRGLVRGGRGGIERISALSITSDTAGNKVSPTEGSDTGKK
jgi:hypothetical protein